MNVSRTIPEILHKNTDGHTPHIVFQFVGARSRADILLCYKSRDMDVVGMEYNSLFPFAVLSANKVSLFIALFTN